MFFLDCYIKTLRKWNGNMLVKCIISKIKLDFMIKFTLINMVYIKKALGEIKDWSFPS